jgi:hypothetical protein
MAPGFAIKTHRLLAQKPTSPLSGSARGLVPQEKSTAAACIQAITVLPRGCGRQGCGYFRGALDRRCRAPHPFVQRAQSALVSGKGVFSMKRIGSQLRSATFRIVRRLAEIADIAAASLPSAGA